MGKTTYKAENFIEPEKIARRVQNKFKTKSFPFMDNGAGHESLEYAGGYSETVWRIETKYLLHWKGAALIVHLRVYQM